MRKYHDRVTSMDPRTEKIENSRTDSDQDRVYLKNLGPSRTDPPSDWVVRGSLVTSLQVVPEAASDVKVCMKIPI